MSIEEPVFCLRDSTGIQFLYGPHNTRICNGFPKVESPYCRDMQFSKDGSLFAYCTNQQTHVINNNLHNTVSKVGDSGVLCVDFSPKGTYISTWTPYVAKQSVQESSNLHIWNVKSGECVKSFIQKKQKGWNPQWSDDEKICGRNVNNEVHFFEDANFDTIAKKIFMQKVAYFSLAPGTAPYHNACFVPGMKGQPSFVRLFKYPNFEGANAVIAQKSFFKAERLDFYWNKIGKDCIIMTSVDVDKSGSSYYGELNLYYASVKGETAKIKLGKDGPVYSLEWSPYSMEFCVVYGYMPAKATVYNLKCEPVMDFEPGPRNEVKYSPSGDRLSLSGFGNLQGQIEVWDLKSKKQISKFKAQDSTYIQWSCDGEYILTATTSPRLRIGNGYRIWHYTGSLLVEVFCEPTTELFDIRWKPVPEGTSESKPTTFTPVAGIKSAVPEVSKQVYRPPAAQGRDSKFKLHDDVATKNDVTNNSALSKNQKKHLARKLKKEQDKPPEDTPNTVAPYQGESSFSGELTGDPEKDKKIKSILRKLDQIEKLKKEQQSGKTLEKNQLEKIDRMGELEADLVKLQVA